MDYKDLEITTENVLDLIKNKQGFNFDSNGKVVSYKKGFMVGGFHKCLKYVNTDFDNLRLGIESMLYILRYYFNKDYILGWWESGGCIYLDISKNINDFYDAITIAFTQNQKAIYDIENDKEITLENLVMSFVKE